MSRAAVTTDQRAHPAATGLADGGNLAPRHRMALPAVNTTLHTYLNDHLSGSSAAIQLLDHLIDTAAHDQERSFFQQLQSEVAADRATLEQLLVQSGGEPSGLRKAGGALMEWLGRLKLAFDDPSHQQLSRLEALEILALGLHGKRGLWRALAVAAADPHGLDFTELERRAEDQHQHVEARRLETARRVLGARL